MRDLPTQINLARFTEAAIGICWVPGHNLNLARAMVLPPALDTALSSLSGNPAALVGVVRNAKHPGQALRSFRPDWNSLSPPSSRLWGAGALCRAW